MDETLEERLAAVERALTEGEDAVALPKDAATEDRVEALEADLDELTDRVAELEAATQALRGYVGNVRSVNSEVEQQAAAALSKAERAHQLATENATAGTSSQRDQSERDQPTAGDSSTAGAAGRTDESRHEERCSRCGARRTDEHHAETASPAGRSRVEELGDLTGTDVGRESTDSPVTRMAGDGGRAIDGDDDEPGLLTRMSDLL